MTSMPTVREQISASPPLPDAAHYRKYQTHVKILHPWDFDPDVVATCQSLEAAGLRTLVSAERLSVIKWAALQTQNLDGEVWEAGVYQGGVAYLLKRISFPEPPEPRPSFWRRIENRMRSSKTPVRPRKLRLFDTFEGLPEATAGIDHHHRGDYADTSAAAVKAFVGAESFIDYREGLIPDTFRGLEKARLRFAHIDLDMYQSTLDCLEFIYPRLLRSGIGVIDDYGFISCPGVRRAVDRFFDNRPETPLSLPSGNALFVKL
jgi:O-methyltransferase